MIKAALLILAIPAAVVAYAAAMPPVPPLPPPTVAQVHAATMAVLKKDIITSQTQRAEEDHGSMIYGYFNCIPNFGCVSAAPGIYFASRAECEGMFVRKGDNAALRCLGKRVETWR